MLVPYASQGCEWRDRAWVYVRAHYEREHPDWPVVVGTCVGDWSKGHAVADALSRTDADTLVIADADSWVDPTTLAAVVGAGVPWALPHTRVHRLSEAATAQTYAGTPGTDTHRPPYRGVVGGGVTVVRRDVYENCPIDTRFYGWGGEDISWGWALRALHGPPLRGDAILWHLWHPSDRVGRVGSPASSALAGRWKRAARRGSTSATAATLHEILEEARCSQPTSSRTP